jgi:renalase
MTHVAIIGAGVAGLACARLLVQAGVDTTVFDKGRGIGGRVATRRAGNLRFDHGAPYAAAGGDDFAACLRGLRNAGYVAPWVDDTGRTWAVGTPGMSALAKGLAVGLDVRLGTQITSVRADEQGWCLQCEGADHVASHVVVTVPAPQMVGLLGDAHPLIEQIAEVEMSPGLTLMAAIAGDVSLVRRSVPNEPLSLVLHDSSKPDRPQNDTTSWVAQAGPTFAKANIESDLPDIAALMVCMDGSYLQGVFRVWHVVICMYVSGLLVRHCLWP